MYIFVPLNKLNYNIIGSHLQACAHMEGKYWIPLSHFAISISLHTPIVLCVSRKVYVVLTNCSQLPCLTGNNWYFWGSRLSLLRMICSHCCISYLGIMGSQGGVIMTVQTFITVIMCKCHVKHTRILVLWTLYIVLELLFSQSKMIIPVH